MASKRITDHTVVWEVANDDGTAVVRVTRDDTDGHLTAWPMHGPECDEYGGGAHIRGDLQEARRIALRILRNQTIENHDHDGRPQVGYLTDDGRVTEWLGATFGLRIGNTNKVAYGRKGVQHGTD